MTTYFTAPYRTYGSKRYEKMLNRVRQSFPNDDIFEPCRVFRTREEWIFGWNTMLDLADRLVFITDEQGWIGKGSFDEIRRANGNGKEVRAMTDSGLMSVADMRIAFHDPDNWAMHLRFDLDDHG